MAIILPGSAPPKPPALDPGWWAWLEEVARRARPDRLEADVRALPGPRNRLHALDAMTRAEDQIADGFRSAGCRVERRPFTFREAFGYIDYGSFAEGRVYSRLDGVNIVAELEGTAPAEAVAVLAHYDTVRDSPGADDNTASVAALLELARVLAGERFRRTVLLVATDMEELNFFGAKALAAEAEGPRRVVGVVNFETMAYTSAEPGSQGLPPGIDLLFPRQVGSMAARQMRGDFNLIFYRRRSAADAAVLGAALQRLAGDHSVLLMRDPVDLPLTGSLIRRLVPAAQNFARGDHVPFWDRGVPAVTINDTANFRYPHYHQATDTPEKLDYVRLAALVGATAGWIGWAAGRA